MSVVVDTFNHEGFIVEAISSVVNQTLPASEREIIVVDDGSTDGTFEEASKWVPHVQVLRKKNGGQASAFNAGIEASRGEFVAFLDGDDWWTADKLDIGLKALEANPEIGCAGHGQYEYADKVGVLATRVPDATYNICLADQDAARLYWDLRWCLAASRLTIRRSILNRLGPIPDELVIGGDEWIIALAPAIAPAIVIDKPLFYYRFHENNNYHLTRPSPDKARLYQKVQSALYKKLPPRLRQLGVTEDVVPILMEPLWVNAERIRLQLDGGWPFSTFRVERANYLFHHASPGMGYRAFKALILGLSLVLPPRVFYRLQQWYYRARMGTARGLLGRTLGPAHQGNHTIRRSTGFGT